MSTLTVDLADRSYPVYLDEPGSLGDLLKQRFPDRRFALVTNTTMAELYAERIAAWEKEVAFVKHIVPDGEQYKNITTWKEILDTFLDERLDRSAVVIAFGGGVVGDMAGFAAAAFMRGIDYVQVPTTLLAMVDSSLGGKTGVNHPHGKNMIGAFHQPRLVWVETGFLKTLPEREFLAGYAEVFKNAFIGGPEMFEFIDHSHDDLVARESVRLSEAIRRSVAIKAAIVSEDEREGGKRALLNFGHTFAHALEAHYNYIGILHGEAVHWGMRCALDLARRSAMIPPDVMRRFASLGDKILRPEIPSHPAAGDLYDTMFTDKKVQGGALRLVLPLKPGESVVRADIPREMIIDTLREVFGR